MQSVQVLKGAEWPVFYLEDDRQLTTTSSRRRLRSSNVATSEVSRTHTSVSDRSFAIAEPRLCTFSYVWLLTLISSPSRFFNSYIFVALNYWVQALSFARSLRVTSSPPRVKNEQHVTSHVVMINALSSLIILIRRT